MAKKKLGDLLIEAGLIDEFQVKAALNHQKKWGGRLGSNLISLGFITEESLLNFFSNRMGLICVDLSKMRIPPHIIKRVPRDIAEKYTVIPVGIEEEGLKSSLILAMSDPTNLSAVDEIRFLINMNVKPAVALHSSIIKAIGAHYVGTVHEKPDFVKEEEGMRQSIDVKLDSPGEDDIVFYGLKKPSVGVESQESQTAEAIPANQKSSSGALPADLPKEIKWTRALIKLLIEKGVITKDELMRKIRMEP